MTTSREVVAQLWRRTGVEGPDASAGFSVHLTERDRERFVKEANPAHGSEPWGDPFVCMLERSMIVDLERAAAAGRPGIRLEEPRNRG